jgi:hypothetical protein
MPIGLAAANAKPLRANIFFGTRYKVKGLRVDVFYKILNPLPYTLYLAPLL